MPGTSVNQAKMSANKKSSGKKPEGNLSEDVAIIGNYDFSPSSFSVEEFFLNVLSFFIFFLFSKGLDCLENQTDFGYEMPDGFRVREQKQNRPLSGAILNTRAEHFSA